MEEILEKEEMEGGSTECQARCWGQDDLQEKEKRLRGRTENVDLPLKGSGRSKGCPTHSPQRQRETEYVW